MTMKFSLALKKTLLALTAVAVLSSAFVSSGAVSAEGVVERPVAPEQTSGPDDVRNSEEQQELNSLIFEAVKEDSSIDDVISVTNAADGTGSTKGQDPATYLPINRWGGSQPVSACDSGGFFSAIANAPCKMTQKLASLLYIAASFVWTIAYGAVSLASKVSFVEGGVLSGALSATSNSLFSALQGSLVATGVFALAVCVVFIQAFRRVVSGKQTGVFRVVLLSFLPLVALMTMATAVAKEGDDPGSVTGSPVWIANKGLGAVSDITGGLVTSIGKVTEFGTVESPSNQTATSCQAYTSALDSVRTSLEDEKDMSVGNEAMLSEFWMTSYMQPLVESQFGSGDLEANRVWCHLYESENSVPRAVQVELGQLAGYPGFISNNSEAQQAVFNALLGEEGEFDSLSAYTDFVGGQTDPYGIRQYGNEHSKLVAANFWQACIWDGAEWKAQPAWNEVSGQAVEAFDASGTAYTDEACASWWYLGDGSGHLKNGGLHDIWPAASPAPETVANYAAPESIGSFVTEQPEDVYRHTAAGFNTGFWPGAVSLVTALILTAPVISLALGSSVATLAFAVLLAMLPITLLLVVAGRKEQSSPGKKLLRATMSFGALTLTFQLGMAALLFTTKFVQSTLGSLAGDGFIGYVGSLLSPIVAIVVLRTIYKRLGFGSLTNPVGAASAVMAAGNMSAESGLLNARTPDGKKMSAGQRLQNFRKQAQDGTSFAGLGKKRFGKAIQKATSEKSMANLGKNWGGSALWAASKRTANQGRVAAGERQHRSAQRLAAMSVAGKDGDSGQHPRLVRTRARLLAATGTALGVKSAAKQEGIEASKMKQQFNQAKTFFTARTDSDREARALQKQNMLAVDATAAEILDDAKREGRFLTRADARAEARRRIADNAVNSVASVTDPLTGEPLMSDGAEVKAIYRIDEATGLKVRVNPEEAGAVMVNGELQLKDGFFASTALSTDTRWSENATKEIGEAYAERLGISKSSVVVDPVSGQSFPAPPKVKKDANGQVVGLEYPKDMSEAAQEEYAKLGINTWEPSTIQKYERLESDRERAAFITDYLASNGQINAAGEIIPAYTLHGKSKSQVMEVMALAADGNSEAALQLVVTPRRGAGAAAEAAALKVRHEEVVWNKRAQVGEQVESAIVSYMKDLPQAKAEAHEAAKELSAAYKTRITLKAEKQAVQSDVTLSTEDKSLKIAALALQEQESVQRLDEVKSLWSAKAAVELELSTVTSELRKISELNAANESLDNVTFKLSELADSSTGKTVDEMEAEMLALLSQAERDYLTANTGKLSEVAPFSPSDLEFIKAIDSQADAVIDAEKQRAKRIESSGKAPKTSRSFGKNTKSFPN